ncbi:hypothetical protein G6F57_004580 [Rhizopus arrhizus]|uniref:Nitrogen regulatory protein areA GATA-like domain-containing protein n=1 Tax=Rhizopus oryzae TaxID=64495 RepID=A0A9P6XGB6_RHIOR|nr:hypothetical protein G6F23_004595 [Rhizopus arrhizus]KAG1423055.1 hypothetical protein G6F58_002993 [Rhizopus delemar]KAG0761846.1 hypothetical protein G6F24_007259 [Rhizopus arrhizus]KAG0788345.1 hypothetical protein G6F21_007280 [Rhizopus arrhizus]KAG0794309.1 hypothetical protein G6F22_005386 [Rhizopus arrhizus]
MCVDYLSYKFDEMDLAASWRVMTKQKKDIVDGIRLENASWRTWAKQRNNLRTISPQTLNWLKDSDVTWLYGPLHTVIQEKEDRFTTPRTPKTEETLNLMIPKTVTPTLKPALKKVTEKDLLKRSANLKNNNNHRKLSISEANNKLHAVSPVILANHRQPKLRFNHEVEQCIALTDAVTEDSSEEDEEWERRKKSIKIIAPARLKRSQSDVESVSSSSSSFNEAFSTVTKEEPIQVTKRTSIVKEKSDAAEPALVTMHQTATDIQKDSTGNNGGGGFFELIRSFKINFRSSFWN